MFVLMVSVLIFLMVGVIGELFIDVTGCQKMDC